LGRAGHLETQEAILCCANPAAAVRLTDSAQGLRVWPAPGPRRPITT